MTADLPVPLRPKVWSDVEPAAAGTGVLVAALAVGVLAAATLRLQGLGLATSLVGVTVLAVASRHRLAPPAGIQLLWAGTSVGLLAVCSLRGATWLAVLCLIGAVGVGTLALIEVRTWTGTVVGSAAAALGVVRAGRWVLPGLRSLRPAGFPSRRAALVAGVCGLLIVVFGGLFVAADPAYGSLVENLLPDLLLTDVARRLLVLLAAASLAVVAMFLAQVPPQVDALAPGPGRAVRRWEWVLPLAVLDALFVSFVVVQVAVLFGGRDHVLATQDLSYAEYARSGFWQLLVVTVLTLVVVAAAVRTGPRATTSDRVVLRSLLGLLCLLTLVVVASAVQRMALYQQEYGFTRLRLLVDAIELSLGAVFVLLVVSGIRLSARWLPRAVVGVGVSALLALAIVNPDAWIASHNVDRYARTGQLDVAYLAGLSSDAVPALLKLPAPLRACALEGLAADLGSSHEPWWDSNRSRSVARRLLVEASLGECRSRAHQLPPRTLPTSRSAKPATTTHTTRRSPAIHSASSGVK